MTDMTRRSFLTAGMATGFTAALGTKALSQPITADGFLNVTYNSLKRIYRSPAGQDIINQGYTGNAGQRAFSVIAEGIRDGRFDNRSTNDRYRILGCHLSDLEGMAGQIANQIHPYTGRVPMPNSWPLFEKIRGDAEKAYNEMRQYFGYNLDCGQMRITTYRYLEPTRNP